MKTGDSFNLNLLPSQAKFQAARTKLQKIIRSYMAIGIVVWILVTVVTLALYFSNGLVLANENKKYEQALSGFKGMSEEVVLSQLIKYRIKVLGQVMKERFEYSTAFEKVTSIFVDKAWLTKFEIDKDKNFSIIASANTKEAVDYIESKVSEANQGKIEGIKSMTINGVSYTIGTGNWDVNMEVILK